MGCKAVATFAAAGMLAVTGAGSASASEPAPQPAAATCSCVTTIDGYVFVGMPYSDAVNQWLEMQAKPGYVSLPAVTSVSTTLVVSGTVSQDGDSQGANTGAGNCPPNCGDQGDAVPAQADAQTAIAPATVSDEAAIAPVVPGEQETTPATAAPTPIRTRWRTLRTPKGVQRVMTVDVAGSRRG